MVKFIKYILPVFFVAVVGCDNVDFGDMNANVNGAQKPATSGLLSGAIMSLGTSGSAIPTLMVQYQAQVVYTDEMLYAQTPYSWAGYYTLINSLNQVIDITSDPAQVTADVLLQGSAANQKATAMILKSIIFKRITDTWGDVPYTESSLGIKNISPKYDKQEDIYKGLIKDLQDARDLINEEEKAPTGDILYFGNLASWKKLANSVLIQMSVQLSKRYPEVNGYAAEVFNEAYKHEAGFIRELSDEAWFTYDDLTNLRNPWIGYRDLDYYLTKEFTDALKGNINETSLNPTSNSIFDDRYKVYVSRTQEHPEPDGIPYGYRDGEGDASTAQMSFLYYWNSTSPLPLMTASYTYLNIAEAAALGWTSANANTMLTNGIIKSFQSLERQSKASVDNPAGTAISGSASSYAAARVSDAEFAPGGIMQIIGEEKWISLFAQPYDAWAEHRRTGYPMLQPATDHYNDGNIPTRFIYPREEATLNGANYRDAVNRIGQDINTTRVWWDID